MILSDLCSCFLNRRLLWYINYDLKEDVEFYVELKGFFEKVDIDLFYYLVIDFFSDLFYDYYFFGVGSGKDLIKLLMGNGELCELLIEFLVVEVIGWECWIDIKLYYLFDFIESGYVEEVIIERMIVFIYVYLLKEK